MCICDCRPIFGVDLKLDLIQLKQITLISTSNLTQFNSIQRNNSAQFHSRKQTLFMPRSKSKHGGLAMLATSESM